MVMKKNMMRKNLRQSILHSMGRYLAIVAIIALGAGMFVGLRTTKTDMIATGQLFTDQQNMFDLRLISSVGWDPEAVEQIAALDGVVDAEAQVSMDALMQVEGSTDETVFKLYAIPEKIDRVYLLGGRMPQSPNECLADGFHATDDILGQKFTVAQTNDADTLDSLTEHTFTVVGYVSTPLYMDMSRGNTTLGNGTVSAYLFLQPEVFDLEYLTEIHITLPGDYEIYSQAHEDAMAEAAEKLESAVLPIARSRWERFWAEYNDGLAEYEDGLAEYTQAKEEALAELADAKQELLDGEAELADGKKQLQENEALLADGEAELNNARYQLQQTEKDTYAQFAAGEAELEGKEKEVAEGLAQVDALLQQWQAGLAQLDAGIAQLEAGAGQLTDGLAAIEAALPTLEAGITATQAALEQALALGADSATVAQLEQQLQQLMAEKETCLTQKAALQAQLDTVNGQLDQLKQQRQEVYAQGAQLETTKATLLQAKAALESGREELAAARIQAEKEFSNAWSQLRASQRELDESKQQLADAKEELIQAETDLADGWKAYEEGEAEAQQEFADAEAELEDARLELEDAKASLEELPDPEVYLLDRNTNVGYVALDSNSDIVEGVSTVFPAFFLLIAALVCITTMTRMVEEERTQIGTLKSMGYSDGAVISKYLVYAGSAAVLGCGFGVFAGSVIFPLILWDAYQIMMLLLPELKLVVDVPLCLLVLGAYTAVTLFVTWYTCRRTLREVPAELIRPKPPTSGKKILLERLPFWNRISFLNKVMLRNILRYRQRLLMMLVGIGGCTALLLTGFGFRDSIVDIVSYQFDEITLYDMDLRYEHAVTPEQRQALEEAAKPYAEDLTFYHQSSLELDSGNGVKDILMIAAEEDFSRFMDFHSEDEKLAYPGVGEALLSVGMATNLDISVGDTVTLRDANMRPLEVRISGLYDNYVYNYVVLTPETVEAQWQETPDMQMACLQLKAGVSAHEAAADLTDTDGVINITVNADTAEMIGSMLEALDMIVLTIVVCAGLLAGTVLYNLTNINITERVREIATIKVLGFHAGESAAYVFKENLLLSFLGVLVGLPGGILLLEFVMSQIQIDMVWMPARLEFFSYILAMVLTMLCACLVDFLLYFKLEKINMAEALKSVE